MDVTISDIVNRNYYVAIQNPIQVDNIVWVNPETRKVYRYYNNQWVEINGYDLFYYLLQMLEYVYPNKRNFRTCW